MRRPKVAVSLLVATLGAVAAVMIVVLAASDSTPDQTSEPQTPYPGGTWEPPPPEYGELDVDTTVTMPDGTELAATIGYPADPETGARADGPFPVVFQHSPYTNMPNSYFVERGYIWANVRPRGTGASEGTITLAGPKDANDAKTLVPWAADLPGSNGNVGQIGCSFPAFYAWADGAAIGPDSPLKASVIQCFGGGKGVNTHEAWLSGGIAAPLLDSGSGICAITGEATPDAQEVESDVLPEGIPPGSGITVGQPRPECISTFGENAADTVAGGDRAYTRQYWNEREGDFTEAIERNGIPVLVMTNWGDVTPGTALWNYAQFQNAYAGRPVYGPMSQDQETTARHRAPAPPVRFVQRGAWRPHAVEPRGDGAARLDDRQPAFLTLSPIGEC